MINDDDDIDINVMSIEEIVKMLNTNIDKFHMLIGNDDEEGIIVLSYEKIHIIMKPSDLFSVYIEVEYNSKTLARHSTWNKEIKKIYKKFKEKIKSEKDKKLKKHQDELQALKWKLQSELQKEKK